MKAWLIIGLLVAYHPLRAQDSAAQKHEQETKQSPAPTIAPNSEPAATQEKNSTPSKQGDSLAKRLMDALIVNWPLVIVGIATLFVIGWQAKEMAKATKVMRRSTEATEKSVKLQETMQQQWVQVDGWRRQGGGSREESPPRFEIAVEITNPTDAPMTVEAVSMSGGGRSVLVTRAQSKLAPNGFITFRYGVVVKPEEVALYATYRLSMVFKGSVFYVDAFENRKEQPFSQSCVFGPNGYAQFSPFEKLSA